MNLQTTNTQGVQPLFQPALNRHILLAAKPSLVHQQFGQKATLTKGQGKTVTWDKMTPLPKASVPLVEGVTPNGRAVNISRITEVPKQYGDYVATSDQFDFFAIDPDPKVLRLNELLANQAGQTLDGLTADVLATGTNVQFVGGKIERASLTDADVLTVDEVKKAVRTLKGNNAPKINGDYICIIHTDIAHDLTNDPDWKNPHTYADTKELYEGEIGKLWGVRFVETTEAKVFRGNNFADKYPELTIYSVKDTKITLGEELSSEDAADISGEIVIDGVTYTVSSATAGASGEAYLTVTEKIETLAEPGMKIYPKGGNANNNPVYSTLILGADAYGVTPEKSNLTTIVKALGSAGSADPLDQRATMGWKAFHLARILENLYMVRIESSASRWA